MALSGAERSVLRLCGALRPGLLVSCVSEFGGPLGRGEYQITEGSMTSMRHRDVGDAVGFFFSGNVSDTLDAW